MTSECVNNLTGNEKLPVTSLTCVIWLEVKQNPDNTRNIRPQKSLPLLNTFFFLILRQMEVKESDLPHNWDGTWRLNQKHTVCTGSGNEKLKLEEIILIPQDWIWFELSVRSLNPAYIRAYLSCPLMKYYLEIKL